MRLTDLDARFLGRYRVEDGHACYSEVDSLDEAQGVIFQCPKCAAGCERGEEDGRRFAIGAHSVLCWFANPRTGVRVPDDADPKPGRWYAAGTSLDDLTFTGPGACSVLLTSGCGWHGFVSNGDAA